MLHETDPQPSQGTNQSCNDVIQDLVKFSSENCGVKVIWSQDMIKESRQCKRSLVLNS